MAENGATKPLSKNAFVRLDSTTGKVHTREYRVEVVTGPDSGRSLVLEGTIKVGTAPTAELQLTDETVSRFHLELSAESNGVRIRDLGSTNGTLVEGALVHEIQIARTTTLAVGNTKLRIVLIDLTLPSTPTPRHFEGLVGESPPMQRLAAIMSRLADSDVTTLLQGETGTGKGLIAQALHQASDRRAGPFISVHAADLTIELAESELFGHAAGAFTGASQTHLGFFERADGGTLFLDELAELPALLQPKLLRVLETRRVRPVGSEEEKPVDVRVIAATQRSLEAEVERGTFRRDLYYRIAVALVHVPTLRDRKEDFPLLVRHFAAGFGRPDLTLSGKLEKEWLAHSWPGNVRELQNCVERWTRGDDPSPRRGSPLERASRPHRELRFKEAKEQVIQSFEVEYLESLLERHDGNVAKAAEAAGLARTYLYSLLKKLGLAGD